MSNEPPTLNEPLINQPGGGGPAAAAAAGGGGGGGGPAAAAAGGGGGGGGGPAAAGGGGGPAAGGGGGGEPQPPVDPPPQPLPGESIVSRTGTPPVNPAPQPLPREPIVSLAANHVTHIRFPQDLFAWGDSENEDPNQPIHVVQIPEERPPPPRNCWAIFKALARYYLPYLWSIGSALLTIFAGVDLFTEVDKKSLWDAFYYCILAAIFLYLAGGILLYLQVGGVHH